MDKVLREKAIYLRTAKELSYTEIKKRLNVPKSTLSYWLREFPLSEEKILKLRREGWKKGEVSRERYRNTMRQKKECRKEVFYKNYLRHFAKIDSQTFFASGLMLYAAEGDKKSDARVNLANTDPQIIIFFIRWLKEFWKVNDSMIHIQLHLYENMDIAKEEKFWQNTVLLSKGQFYKTQIRKLQSNSFSYQGSFRHGTCSIYVLGTERKLELMGALRAFTERACSSVG